MLVVLLASWVAASASEECESCTSFMQMRLQTHETTVQADALPQKCLETLTWQSFRQPIRQTLAHYPGEDGYCIYAPVGRMADCAVARSTGNLSDFTRPLHESDKESLKHTSAAPAVTFVAPDGSSLRTRDRQFPMDDLYCFVNGWYQLPREQAANNYSFLEQVSREYCAHMAKKVPGFHERSMADWVRQLAEDEAWLEAAMKSGQEEVQLPKNIVAGIEAHGATKCLLEGEQGGALCDIAHCAARGAVVDGLVLYSSQGEVPEV
mmetsp:Transcript_104706/g.249314  ORF Transcript_104706/g.249314 Transcript_104706/m.249314 type:complete len:265 (+) Transcript_104706:47-841(+)